jgi:hypothetical protein
MASATAPHALYSLLRGGQNGSHLREDRPKIEKASTRSTGNHNGLRIFASQGPRKRQRPPPGEVNPRLHSGTGDEGWIGGSTRSGQSTQQKFNEQDEQNVMGDKFADLLNDQSDSHYQ